MIKRLLIFLFIVQFPIVHAQDEDDVLSKILVQYSLQDYIGCVETCNQLISIAPKKGEAYYYKALSKMMMGDLRGTEADMIIARKHGGNTKDPALKFWSDEAERRKFIIKSFYKDRKVYPELGYRPRYTRKDSLRGALRPERTCFDVTFYNLKVKINTKKKTITGSNDITFKVVEPTQRIQIDLFGIYKIESITWQNKSLSYHREFDAVFVDFPDNLSVGSLQTVTVKYSGKPRNAPNPPWDGGFVWKRDKKDNWWCGVACEQFGASSWWPCKDHPSDEPDSAQLTFIAPEGYDIISNGRLRHKEPAEKGFTSHAWFVSYPINNYNVTFYMGKFSHFSDTITNKLGKYPLDYYVLPYNLDEARKCFTQTKGVLQFYEKAFGEYPFMKDKYSLIESPYEGMEHQSAIAYGNDFNKKDDEQMYLNKKEDYIIVHETAHEWWGNSVTASDMADIWLQEGFATYAELMFIENKYGHDEYLKELKRKLQFIFNIWPIVDNYNVNENAFASNDCYNKGAAVLNNLRCTMANDTLFFKLIKDFSQRYRLKIATTKDFTSMVNEYTGKDYTAFFKKFLYDKNLPVLKYTYRKEGKNIVLKYQWEEVDKGFAMPVGICTNDGASFRLEATTEPQEITLKNTTTFRFYTQWIEPDKVQRNAYTYYWTKCGN
ncbi:MAG: M1 family metallopeptidase [Bacteroidota bacterium]|nr:M1 family metallopeptidase [Bacteroidota bacterium]